MKLRSLVFGLCVSLCSSVFAANHHARPQTNHTDNASQDKNVSYPGYCEIEIINLSFDDVTVYGQFDDGEILEPFNVYSFESPLYIPLYYYGYCHAGMNLSINTFRGDYIYSGYVPTGMSIRIVPYLANQLKVELNKK